MAAWEAAAGRAPAASQRRLPRQARLLACMVLAAIAVVAPWQLRVQDTAGLVDVAQEAASQAGGKGLGMPKQPRDDEILPGVVGAVRQAFLALIEKQCDIVFDEVDHDSNGKLNSAELHVAVLLAYGRLNQILGSMALTAPNTGEVKALLAASDNGKGGLTRDGFKDVFVRKFMHQVAAQAAARLIVSKVLIPAGAVGLNLLANECNIGTRLEDALSGHSGWTGPKGMVARSVRRTVTNTAISQLGRALGPLINMNLATALARAAHVEDLIQRMLNDRRSGAMSSSAPATRT